MTDAVLSFAVQKLGDFLLQKIVDRINFRANLEWLRNELGYMRSFILDAEEKQCIDHRMQQWISEITDVAHETMDILDDFNRKIGGRKPGFANSLSMCACICSREADLYNYGQRIESLRQRVTDVSRKRETYGIRNLSDHSAGEGPSRAPNNRSSIFKTLRRATSYVDQDRLFVGFEDVTQTLLGELLKMEPRRSVISIYGMGGLGKTTIARELYNSSNVMDNFPYRAWVCVSQEYSTSDLLRTLIKSFRKRCFKDELKMIEGMDEEDLERYLRDMLKDHKYLAVVDDIWHKEAWESLKRAFPDDKNGSRVIITTRKKDVATRVDDRSFAHELRFLTPDESWDLFCKKISHGDESWCSEAMKDLGREMVKKCGGLPLALVVLGGLLCHKKSLQEWRDVKEHIWRHLKNDSLEISYLLSLSYDDLPVELKQCFLYVGGFLEDCLIDVEKLKWLWMAEGFITSREARMEDVADHYLNELMNRSMIQIADKIWDKYANCRIHDLLRDLAVQKAIEVNFFDIHDPRKCSTPPSGQRHIVHRQIGNYFSLALPNWKTRSVVVFNPDHEEPQLEHLYSLCGNFTNLHVLHLENCYFNFATGRGQLPYDIGNLINLKFLGLIDTNFRCLPSSLGNLKNLETIYAYMTILALPPEMSELTNLRHLVAFCRGPVNISSLTNLETLKYVKADDWLKMDTTHLVNLRELVIQEILSYCKLDSIGKLRSLTTLTLTCSVSQYFPPLQPLSSCPNLLRLWLGGRISSSSQLKNLPRSIMVLTLQQSGLREDPMAVLETFPNLQSLELRGAYSGVTITCTGKGFPELELLRFRNLEHLSNWQLEDEAMPMIKGLGLFKCPRLIIPERLNHVSKLKEMENRGLPYPSTWA